MAIHFDTQGPAPDGFHVPTKDEWATVCNTWVSLWAWTYESPGNLINYLKLPWVGYRNYRNANVSSQGYNFYWSSSRYDENTAYSLSIGVGSPSLQPQKNSYRSQGFPVRCFKDRPVIPDNNRTQLYDWGDWPQWELTWIYHNATLWLISISSDWTNRTTIQDKNLWATTVWNNWDTLSEANCGYYYQRWNNYGFPFAWSVTTSWSQVDASTYWPWDYYSSSTFITWNQRWDTTDNWNLRWWVSQWTWETPDPVRLHWAIQTFHRAPHYDWYLNGATIAYYPLTEDLLDHKDNWNTLYPLTANGSWYSFSANADLYKAIYFTWGTYLYPWSGNIRGKHPWTDDMTIAFRVSWFTSPAYWTYGYSWYHSWILSFDRTFKTGVWSDWVVWRWVGLLDLWYEWFSTEDWYSTDDSWNPITVTTPLVSWLSMWQTYWDSFISVVDTFHNGHHTRYISSEWFWVEYPYFESNYWWNKSVSQNYIWRDSYSTSNYRYIHWYMRDFVVAWDVWTKGIIKAYFNESLSRWGRAVTMTNTSYYQWASYSSLTETLFTASETWYYHITWQFYSNSGSSWATWATHSLSWWTKISWTDSGWVDPYKTLDVDCVYYIESWTDFKGYVETYGYTSWWWRNFAAEFWWDYDPSWNNQSSSWWWSSASGSAIK